MKLCLQISTSSILFFAISTASLFSAKIDFQSINNEFSVSESETQCSSCINVFDSVDFQHTACLKAILRDDSSAKHFMRGPRGVTPLIEAVRKGYLEGVLALINAKASVQVPDLLRRTPLMYAVAHGNEAIVAALLQGYNADLYTMDVNGRTALDFAIINGHLGCIVRILEFFYKQDQDPLVRAVRILRSGLQISYRGWVAKLLNRKVKAEADSKEGEWKDNLKVFLIYLYDAYSELKECQDDLNPILLYKNDEWHTFYLLLLHDPLTAYYRVLDDMEIEVNLGNHR